MFPLQTFPDICRVIQVPTTSTANLFIVLRNFVVISACIWPKWFGFVPDGSSLCWPLLSPGYVRSAQWLPIVKCHRLYWKETRSFCPPENKWIGDLFVSSQYLQRDWKDTFVRGDKWCEFGGRKEELTEPRGLLMRLVCVREYVYGSEVCEGEREK